MNEQEKYAPNHYDFSGKKLLILAGAGPHSKVVEAAREMGVYTIVVDNLQNSPAKVIADEALMCNIYDIDTLIEYCKLNHVDGVIDFCIDPAQKPAQQIAEGLKLNSFGNSNQTLSLTNKKCFKKLCRECNVDVIKEYSEDDIYNHKLVYPVLVKPADSRGSRGIKVCNNYEQVHGAVSKAKAESINGDIIIEQYMGNNQDLTISYIVKDGKPILVSLGDRYHGNTEDNLNCQLACTIQPSRYEYIYMQNVNQRVKDMIVHLGIQNGAVFMQGFVEGDTVKMYDPGIRFPGNEYERIYARATGYNLMKSLISYVLCGEVDDYNGKLKGTYDLNGKVAIQYMINVGAGKIVTFDGLSEIEKLPFVIDVQQRHFVGDIIENTGDIQHRAGEISILVERNLEEMKNAIKAVQARLNILDENGNSMILSPFNFEKIDELYSTWNYVEL